MSLQYKVCENCETEFKDSFKFCPCCGEAIHKDEDWDEMDPVNWEDED